MIEDIAHALMVSKISIGATAISGAAWACIRLLADQSVSTWTEGGIALLFFSSLVAALRIGWKQWQQDRTDAKLELQKLRCENRTLINSMMDDLKAQAKAQRDEQRED